MNWEEVIRFIRKNPDYADLVEKAYFEKDLQLNISRYGQSDEFLEILGIIQRYFNGNKLEIVDVGAGNGIAAINFALKGHSVVAVEPDQSNTIGNGAIAISANYNSLSEFTIIESYGENIPLKSSSFDLVFVRQALHHANDLDKFMLEAQRLLKHGGLFLAIREHVIYNQQDKDWFLQEHPLQKFYGGENAFTLNQYTSALKSANLKLIRVLKYYDSIINYFPITTNQIHQKQKQRKDRVEFILHKVHLGKISFLWPIVSFLIDLKEGKVLDERKVPGRMYSFLAMKK